MKRRLKFAVCVLALLTVPSLAASARAADRLCDPANEDCRAILLNLIRNETVGIDVAFWFMEDARYSNELIKKWQAGVPVRVIVDTRANASYPHNADRLNELKLAGIPMRERFSGGILHWKMMLFVGQNTVEFSGANYSADAWRPVDLTQPYTNYVDEAIFFTDKDSIVNSFKTKYDDLWVNTSAYRNYANITTPLARNYGTFTKDPELNFPPAENYSTRSTNAYNAEKQKIDVIMYRITDQRHTNAIINAVNRGIPVRLITEPAQYREPSRLWHSWNVDRLYMAGVKIKHRAHPGLNHQKSVLLYGQGMTIFGSSNWTSPSASSQEEHNLFTKDPVFFDWFVQQFERKWNNSTGNIENEDFVPLPPDTPKIPTPANLATGLGTTVTLKWYGGPWAHLYDIYFGTSSNPPLVQANAALGPSENTADFQTFSIPTTLTPGTTYYWKIVAKTMALVPKESAVWSFTTGGTAPPPPPTGGGGEGDIVLYAAEAPVKVGAWSVVTDGTAASGARIYNTNAGLAKVTTPLASPANYFEMTFNAEAGRAYRLWMRGKADNNAFGNDSVHIQFDNSVDANGTPIWRIGTTTSTEYNLEDCSGCGLAGWGWQDNGWGTGVLGKVVYFSTTGAQTIRIQTREDGLSLDQIVLSPATFLSSAPGALKNDTTILSKATGGGGGSEPPPPPPPPPTSTDPNEIVLYAADAVTTGGAWVVEPDVTAAGGAKMRHPDAGAAKVSAPSGAPGNYFELTFNAEAGKPYRLWLRMRADRDYWANDSAWVQFDQSVDVNGNAVYRIGSTSGTDVNLEDCSGCGLAGWGWQDNGYGTGVMGQVIYFATTGPQRIRIQTREDGASIDQIVLSSSKYMTAAPGSLKNDVIILAK